MMGRVRGDAGNGRESPTVSGSTWTPTTPVHRNRTLGFDLSSG